MFSLICKDEMLVTSNKTALAETLRVWSFVQKVAFIAKLVFGLNQAVLPRHSAMQTMRS